MVGEDVRGCGFEEDESENPVAGLGGAEACLAAFGEDDENSVAFTGLEPTDRALEIIVIVQQHVLLPVVQQALRAESIGESVEHGQGKRESAL